MSRHAFLAVASFSLVSLAVACGGAIDSPRADSVDPNTSTPGSSGGSSGGPKSGGGVGATCTAAPTCDPGDKRVASESACPQDTARCYDRSYCGQTIWCAHPVCEGDPACPGDYVPVPSCQGSTDCIAQSVCGQVYYCARDLSLCDGYPACDPGDTQVPSPSQCLQDDAVCYQRSVCGSTIWCTGARPQDGGAPPPLPPAK
jgi:hypothetical protein